MPHEIPAIRIFPMSDRAPGFIGKSIERVQRETFLRDLPKNGGRFRYRATGLSAPPGALILFQYQAHIIASAIFLRDEKRPKRKPTPKNPSPAKPLHTGTLHLDPASIKTFTPLNIQTMQKIWPTLQNFGHVKHALNPTRYPTLKKHLKNLTAPR